MSAAIEAKDTVGDRPPRLEIGFSPAMSAVILDLAATARLTAEEVLVEAVALYRAATAAVDAGKSVIIADAPGPADTALVQTLPLPPLKARITPEVFEALEDALDGWEADRVMEDAESRELVPLEDVKKTLGL